MQPFNIRIVSTVGEIYLNEEGLYISVKDRIRLETYKIGEGNTDLTITPAAGLGKPMRIRLGNDGQQNTSIWVKGHTLEFDDTDGLLYNGKKVLTED